MSAGEADALWLTDPGGGSLQLTLTNPSEHPNGVFARVLQGGSGTVEILDHLGATLSTLSSAGEYAELAVDRSVGKWIVIGAGSSVPGGGASSCVTVVNSLSDLPAPSGGVITLDPNTQYMICAASLSIGSNVIEMPSGSSLVGLGSAATVLSGTGPTILRVPAGLKSVVVEDLVLSGTFTRCVEIVGDGSLSGFYRCTLTSQVEAVSIDGVSSAVFEDCDISGVSGISVTNVDRLVVDRCRLSPRVLGGTGMSLSGGSANQINVDSCLFAPGTGGTGLQMTPGYSIGFLRVEGCSFQIAPPISPADLYSYDKVQFTDNLGVEDSGAVGAIGFSSDLASAPTQTFGAAFEWHPIPGPWSILGGSQLFTNPSPAVLQYVGSQTKFFMVAGNASIFKNASGNVDVYVRLLLNGVEVAGSRFAGNVRGPNNPDSIVMFSFVQMSQNDKITFEFTNGVNTQSLRPLSVSVYVREAT